MSMKDLLSGFGDQFAWDANIENSESLKSSYAQYVLCGMGGSALGGRLLTAHDPLLPLQIHSNYGLPHLPAAVLKDSLLILSSYSGNTEEVLDTAAHALKEGVAVCIVTSGGALEQFARDHALPLMLFHPSDIEPRMAIGYTVIALARLMGTTELEQQIRDSGSHTNAEAHRAQGESIGNDLIGNIPFIYSSEENIGIAYFWKIAFNETSKIPSSHNVMSELCHNELSGYDRKFGESGMPTNAYPIFITDDADHPRIAARFELMQTLFTERHMPFAPVPLGGASYFDKAFGSILTGVWAAITLADHYGVPDSKTPLIAEFKERLAAIPV